MTADGSTADGTHHGPGPGRAAGTWTVPGYTDGEELGAGAGGRVVVATHHATGRRVAVKYLSEELCADPGFRDAFRAEAELLGSLGSRHVTAFYEYVEGPRGAAIVMELIPGVALRALLREHGPTGPEAALLVLKGSLLGLADAHRAGVVHRDYKPENVLVRRDGSSALVDFGIARRDGDPGTDGSGAGGGSGISGTPPYMAPEQWRGAPADAATDVYAATVTFYECLTGERPFTGGSLAELAVRHATAPVPLERVPVAVRGLVARGMAKDREQRPHDAREFVAELDRVAGVAFGPRWEENGQRRLASLAALLPLLFRPDEEEPAGTTDLALTRLPAAPVPVTRLPGRPARPGRDRLAWLMNLGALLAAGLALLLTQLPSGWAGEQRAEALATSGAAPPGGDAEPVPDGSGRETADEGPAPAPDGAGPTGPASPEDPGAAGGTDGGTGDPGPGPDPDPADDGATGGPADDPADPADPADPVDPTDATDPAGPDDPTDPAGPADVRRITLGGTSIGYDEECACWVAYAEADVVTDGPEPVTLTVQWYELAGPDDPGTPHGPAEELTLEEARGYSRQLRHADIRAYACDTWYRVEVAAPTGSAEPAATVIDAGCLG